MTALQTAKEKLTEMLTKVDINDPLSSELQTLYTLVESAINEPISLEQAKNIRANDIHGCKPGETWNGTQCVDDLPK